jgi:fructose-1,6-bisphosphatase/inositol monophosphatase family enzyme
MLKIDLDDIAAILRDVAAEEIMPRFRKLAKGDIKHKGDRGDFATTADLESERVLSLRLQDVLPGSVVVGEEATEKRPALLDAIAEPTPSWIVDPLDGTHNFAGGIDQFCVIAALARAGETLAAWIHDPVAGKTIMAERGGGCWEAGRRLSVAAAVPVAEMRGAIYAKAGRPGVSAAFDAARSRFAATFNNRCAGHEYLALARAESHFTLFSRLLPWDHAGGALIHAEAGGYNACWDGEAYRPTRHKGGLLLAPDAPSWEAIAALLLARPVPSAGSTGA